MWGKQFYHFDVERWLDGDPGLARRRRRAAATGATAHWWHMNSFDVISMPDPWEYPWYAAWDLAFHCVAHRPRRPRLRQGPAAAAAARVVHAPQRADPGLRVGVRRRQPAGARVGGAAGLRDRRRPRLRLPRPGHAQAAAQLHLVGQPQGHRRQQRLRGRLPRPGQRRPVRPLRGAAGGRRAGAVRRHRLDGDVRAEPAGDVAACWPCTTAPTRTSRPSSSSTSRTSPTAAYEQGLWDDEDGFFYDVLRAAGRPQGAAQGPLDGRPAAAGAPPPCSAPCTLAGCPSSPPGCAGSCTNQPEYADVVGARRLSGDGRQQRLLSMVGPDQLRADPGADARRGGVPVPVRPAHAVPAAPGQAVHGARSAGTTSPSATSRPSRPAACSAATPTGAARSGSRSTSC